MTVTNNTRDGKLTSAEIVITSDLGDKTIRQEKSVRKAVYTNAEKQKGRFDFVETAQVKDFQCLIEFSAAPYWQPVNLKALIRVFHLKEPVVLMYSWV